MLRQLLTLQKDTKKLAIIEENRQLTYNELQKTAKKLQSVLSTDPKNPIAIFLPNGGDFLSAFFGVLKQGYTVFPLSILLTKTEVSALLNQANAKTVITNSSYKDFFLDPLFTQHNIIYIDELKESASVPPNHFIPNQTAVLLNTSGTTGKSKVVQLSEKNIMASVIGYLEKMSFSGSKNDIRYILAAPFFSVYGIMIICACMVLSFPIITLNDFLTLDSLFDLAKKHQATHYEGSPTALILMEKFKDRSNQFSKSTLKTFGIGGNKISGTTIKNIMSAYPNYVISQGYGMTEAAPLIAKHPLSKPLKKYDSVGTAIKGTQIFIKSEDGITTKPNINGEVVIKGINVMNGYLNNDDETKLKLKDGYLHTGDNGYLDADGYLYILGRLSNTINVRGFKVCAEEVEECLISCPLIKDCMVFGETDEFNNQIICANVVKSSKKATQKDILSHCKEHLAAYKHPQKIQFVDKIDKNTSWKN